MFYFNPAVLLTCHTGQVDNSAPSSSIWSERVSSAFGADGYAGVFFGDEFLNFGQAATGNDVSGGYGVYLDTSNTITQLASERNGVIRLALDATDNDETWLTSGGNTGVLGVISDASGSDKFMAFEARVRVNQVGDNSAAIFVGLAEEGLAAADTKVDDTGVMADKDFIGFNTIQADGDALAFNYKKEGQTQQSVALDSAALTAGTWVKLGMVYDPRQPSSRRIAIYVDGVKQSTHITGDNIAAATFPDGEELAFLIGLKNGGAVAASLDCDWWCFAQER